MRSNIHVINFILLANAVVQVSRAMDSSIPFINADDVHLQGIDGSGVTVAVIDTGIDYWHHGLLGDIAPGGASFENRIMQQDPGMDIYGYGHGTYMSLNITDAIGVAPYTNILPIRVFRNDGYAYDEDIE